MSAYLDICNNSMKYKYLDSFRRMNMLNVFISKKIENPNYFKVDEIFNDYVTNYNKKFDLSPVKCEFEVTFINYTDFIKTEYFFNTSMVNMKNYLLYFIYRSFSNGRIFSHVHKMKNETFSNIII